MIFNVGTFLFQVLNFLALVYILRRLLYRPLREAIDRRREANVRAQAQAEQAQQEAESLEQQLRSQTAALDQQRQEMVRAAREQAEKERKTMMAEAELGVKRRYEDAERELARDAPWHSRRCVPSWFSRLWRWRNDLHEASGSTLQQQLAGRLVDELQRIPEDERQRLRREWEADQAAVVETAADLNGEILESIDAALMALAGKRVGLTVQPRPELVAGVRLRLGGQVWDASLARAMSQADQSSPAEPNP